MKMAELTQEQYRKAVRAAREGVPMPDGPILPVFHPEAMAQAIESECVRIRSFEGQRITIHMDPADALALAKFLRFRSRG
jgi:hypothetical protein